MSWIMAIALWEGIVGSLELFTIWYVIWGKEWYAKKNKVGVRHGTFLEVSFWDVGIKTGSLPAINLDTIINDIGQRASRFMAPNEVENMKRSLSKILTQKDAAEFIEKIQQAQKKQQ